MIYTEIIEYKKHTNTFDKINLKYYQFIKSKS
jgi:hypothetical protein